MRKRIYVTSAVILLIVILLIVLFSSCGKTGPLSYVGVPFRENASTRYSWVDFPFSFTCGDFTSVGRPVRNLLGAFLAADKLTEVINEGEFDIPYRADDSYRLIRIEHGTENEIWEFEFASETWAEKGIEAGSISVAVDENSGDILKCWADFWETAFVTTQIGNYQVTFEPDILKDYAVINDWETAMDVGEQLMKKLKLEGMILNTIVRATEENVWKYCFYRPELLNTDAYGGGLFLVLDGNDCTILASYAEE